MPKNVELLDNANDILYPKTLAVQVAVNANKDSDTKLNEIDAEFKNYLPLAGENDRQINLHIIFRRYEKFYIFHNKYIKTSHTS